MESIRLIHGDCIEQMRVLAEEGVKVDMVLCDMPYGVTQNKWDSVLDLDVVLLRCIDVSKMNTAFVMFSMEPFASFFRYKWLPFYKYDYTWDKELVSGHLNAKRMPMRRHENICVFYQKQPTYNPQMWEGDPCHSKGTSYKMKEQTNNNYRKFKSVETEKTSLKYPNSILRFQKPHPSKCVHPTQKPVELLEYLIKTYTNEGDTVLDFCMGSGSTGVACKNTARHFIGIELDEEYFKIAEERTSKT